MTSLSDETYDDFIKSNHLAVIVFGAKWNAISSNFIMHQVAEAKLRSKRSVAFAYIDVDLCPAVVSRLAILNIPTVAYYRDGKLFEKIIGASQRLLEKINTL